MPIRRFWTLTLTTLWNHDTKIDEIHVKRLFYKKFLGVLMVVNLNILLMLKFSDYTENSAYLLIEHTCIWQFNITVARGL